MQPKICIVRLMLYCCLRFLCYASGWWPNHGEPVLLVPLPDIHMLWISSLDPLISHLLNVQLLKLSEESSGNVDSSGDS